VPLMADAGLRFLHIGVNTASTPPDVPDAFRWRDPETGAEIVVMYTKAGYGGVSTLGGHSLAFAHTGDNQGPPTREQVIGELSSLRARHPGWDVRASTLDAFAADADAARESLPVVDAEIGDTWIYATASDPWKTAAFRGLQRLRSRWIREGNPAVAGPAFHRFSRELLSVAEHTWGMDQKSYLADYENYARKDFEKARAIDTVIDGVPDDCSFAREYAQGKVQSYRLIEASWYEQRAYLHKAVAALRGTPLEGEAAEALNAGAPERPTACRMLPASRLRRALDTEHFIVRFSPAHGAIVSLVERRTGREWAAEDHPLSLFRYQTLSSGDYDRFQREYGANMDDPETHSWGVPDLGRAGLRPGHSESAFFTPRVTGFSGNRERLVLDLLMPEESRIRYGAPARLRMAYSFPRDAPSIHVEVSWFGKPANRLPEAAWLAFTPLMEEPRSWEMDKLGRWVSPLAVVSRGNRAMHGIGECVRIGCGDVRLLIDSPDAHLVSPGEPRPLRFDDTLPRLGGGMHFCLHANLFGTNFPLWYSDDARFRFRLRLERIH
jgi:hypothetical protein